MNDVQAVKIKFYSNEDYYSLTERKVISSDPRRKSYNFLYFLDKKPYVGMLVVVLSNSRNLYRKPFEVGYITSLSGDEDIAKSPVLSYLDLDHVDSILNSLGEYQKKLTSKKEIMDQLDKKYQSKTKIQMYQDIADKTNDIEMQDLLKKLKEL